MRKSRVLREVREGMMATCAKLNLSDPRVVELCGLAGFSSVWLCNEHVPNDWMGIEHSVRAAKIHDMDVIVRVSKGSYSDTIKPFECDAAGIMVPHVTSADEARDIVDRCRVHPLGNRAMDGGNVDGDFCQIPPEEYARLCNEEKFIILQIESPEGLEQVEAIAAVPGYDFLLFGAGDFAYRIGKAGRISDPQVEAARRRVEAAAKQHGKPCFSAAGVSGSPEELKERGYAIMKLTSDIRTLGGAFAAVAREFARQGHRTSLAVAERE